MCTCASAFTSEAALLTIVRRALHVWLIACTSQRCSLGSMCVLSKSQSSSKLRGGLANPVPGSENGADQHSWQTDQGALISLGLTGAEMP